MVLKYFLFENLYKNKRIFLFLENGEWKLYFGIDGALHLYFGNGDKFVTLTGSYFKFLDNGETLPPTTTNQTLLPTTGHPTFKTAQPAEPTASSPIRTSGQCTGAACSNPEMCRSEWG